jgi:leucyl aminopeptidase (aminopeptidase T)
MNIQDRIKMFKDVFAPKSGEKIKILIDIPHNNIKDSRKWKERREMAYDWYKTFNFLSKELKLNIEIKSYKATGFDNAPIPQKIIDIAHKSNLVIAITEFSATVSLKQVCDTVGSITRCASMPKVEKRMENTSLIADYSLVQRYATSIEKMLNETIGAKIIFSNDSTLYIDLRNRIANSESGICQKAGHFINLPSGEGFKAPYEATEEEMNKFGKSKTQGTLPIYQNGKIIMCIIDNNKIIKIQGESKEANNLNKFFKENITRRNIAELGIGCNPKAVVTGNIIEDEKAGGLHIAYGTSIHVGGKITSDIHQDICYAKNLPIEAESLTLINKNKTKTEVIKNAKLRYKILK